ncbi:hypothetical protein LOD99_6310 [Oopsacas minuta]|uniref:Uncharacterized protein n=1 Tax=Oopsacas minuta TaxID=111878 RepID=A0AAV7JNH5_9METZ|nr:hypothetical protein LOD99_6310 [Oopsacas minuta]
MVDISPVCLDNISTDVSQSDFNMDVQLYQYLKFFDCEDSVSFSSILLCPSPHINLSKNVDIPMVQSNLKTLSGKVSSSVSTSISNDLSSFDSQYDTLLSAKNSNAFIDLPNLSRSLTRIHTPPTPRISNENHPDHMSTISDLSDLNALESFHEFSDNFYEHCNPIYTEASTFSTNQDTYQKCFDDYESNMNISLKNADNGIVPVSFSLISNLSSFETFGDIYNDVHDLQIDSRFSNGLRTSLAQSNFSSTVDSNIYMHSNSVFEPICRSSSFREGSKYFVKVISEFSTFEVLVTDTIDILPTN